MIRSVIRSTGRYVPERRVTNHELTDILDTTDEWVTQRTGIEARYWVEEGDDSGTSDLALNAAKIALERADWQPEELDLIVFSTMTPDVNVPGSGVFLQDKLGAKNVPALDIRQQCTGFLHGLEICDAYIRSGKATKILLVGAEYQSRYLELTAANRDTAVIFGDGAGVVCVEALETQDEVGLITSILHADGRYAQALRFGLPARKSGHITDPAVLENNEHFPYMDGQKVFKLAVTRLPKIIAELLEKANMSIEDIDMFIPHQANLRINDAVRERMKIPADKMYNNIQRYGNTTAATIPIAFDELLEKKLVKSGDHIMFFGLGAGLTWGGLIYKMV
ncbi:3-oxoacyl-ACP synthase III family protein [Desulfoluna sp.]|uniref:3-oxoacyl-ACP synthase III family protein n=1 Tax=Desulfoluna sp. TaxID=2045199 RepID=UPI0026158093|nr:beta-ketoacyl-ACP synthase III [Desulfoluna sp.]